MTVRSELGRRTGVSPSWLLEIDGIAERYYSGYPPDAAAVPAPYTAVFADVQVSIGEHSLDMLKGIAKDGAGSVSLTIDRANSASMATRLMVGDTLPAPSLAMPFSMSRLCSPMLT